MLPRRLAPFVFASLACVAPAFAQAEHRERVIGQVQDKHGHAWADAAVTLFSRAIPGYVRGTRTDEVTVRCDARGRFRAELLPGRPYSAWAVAQAGDTTYRTTAVAEDVLPGRPIRLHEAPELHYRVRLTVRGREAWKAKAPLTFAVHACAPVNVLVHALEIDADQQVVLPALPGDRAWVEVHGKGDYPIYADFVPLTQSERQRYLSARDALPYASDLAQPFPSTDSVADAILAIPPPFTITLQVDDAKGRAIAHPIALRDLEHARGPWYPLATGDANGRVRFEVPALELKNGSHRVRPFDLLVRHPEHADSCLATTEFSLARERGDEPDKTVKLARGCTVTGRILFGANRPAAHLPLVVYSSITYGNGGGQIACGPHTFMTGADGQFELPGRASSRVYRLCAVPGKEHIPELPAELAGLPVLWLRSAKPQPKALGDIRLDELKTTVLELQRPDGSPAARETVYAGESFDPGEAPYYPLRYLTDRRGKLRFVRPEAKSVRLVVASATGAAELELRAGSGPGNVVPLLLGRDRRIEGRLTDTDGNPLPGGVVLTTQLQGVTPDASNWITIGMLARSNHVGSGELYWTSYWKYRRWSRYSHPVSEIPVDSSGRFRIFVPPEVQRATLVGRLFVGGAPIDSPAVTIATDDAGGRTISVPVPTNKNK